MQTSTTIILQTIATIMQTNTSSIILTLHNLGFDFNKSVDEQTTEVDEKVSQMLLNSLTDGNKQPQQEEEPEPQQEEVIQVEVITEQPPIELETIQELVSLPNDKEQDNQVDEKVAEMLLNSLTATTIKEKPQQETTQLIEPVSSSETDRYTQLLNLFNNHTVEPSKVKDKQKLRDEILDILIPKAGQIKGRMQRGKQKLEEVTKMITNSRTKEQLANDLVAWLDGYVAKREKRYGVNTSDVVQVVEEDEINEDVATTQVKQELVITPIISYEDKYKQLIKLFKKYKTPPCKLKNREYLAQNIQYILLQQSESKLLKGKQRTEEIRQMIMTSGSFNELANNLINWLHDNLVKNNSIKEPPKQQTSSVTKVTEVTKDYAQKVYEELSDLKDFNFQIETNELDQITDHFLNVYEKVFRILFKKESTIEKYMNDLNKNLNFYLNHWKQGSSIDEKEEKKYRFFVFLHYHNKPLLRKLWNIWVG